MSALSIPLSQNLWYFYLQNPSILEWNFCTFPKEHFIKTSIFNICLEFATETIQTVFKKTLKLII